MNEVQRHILEQVAGIGGIPQGAFNIRVNGGSIAMNSTENVKITKKADGTGIDIHVKPATKAEKIHIPVVISNTGHQEVVYNDFYIGEGADVTIVAGCGIHNCGGGLSQHDGIHSFYLEKDAKVKYMENHFGEGDGIGDNILNPVTNVYLEPGSHMEMDTVQIKGVNSTKRVTNAQVKDNASIVVREKLMTHGGQYAQTSFNVELNGEGASANVISRSVAKNKSKQVFLSKITGNNACAGHSECDAIIMDEAVIQAIPEITANHLEAQLIHEAAIGKIAGEQLVKLMTLGLTRQQAEEHIVNGFLK